MSGGSKNFSLEEHLAMKEKRIRQIQKHNVTNTVVHEVKKKKRKGEELLVIGLQPKTKWLAARNFILRLWCT